METSFFQSFVQNLFQDNFLIEIHFKETTPTQLYKIKKIISQVLNILRYSGSSVRNYYTCCNVYPLFWRANVIDHSLLIFILENRIIPEFRKYFLSTSRIPSFRDLFIELCSLEKLKNQRLRGSRCNTLTKLHIIKKFLKYVEKILLWSMMHVNFDFHFKCTNFMYFCKLLLICF